MVSIPQPVPGDVALEQELQVLEKLRSKPCFRIGCSEIDDYVLLGGLEAGTVVGLSAEDEEFGLLVRCCLLGEKKEKEKEKEKEKKKKIDKRQQDLNLVNTRYASR